ncbi:DUF982 domain-containing protein [Mesorhizobium sp. M1312]
MVGIESAIACRAGSSGPWWCKLAGLTVSASATILLRSFPHQTKKRKLAMDACLQVLRGEAQSPVARRAFVVAALEAKILRSD